MPYAECEAATARATPLMEAAHNGHLKAAQMLLHISPKAAEVTASDGTTALHFASYSAPMTELLLKYASWHSGRSWQLWAHTTVLCRSG